jgi:hypothetical protein
MGTEEAKEIYKQRAATAECVNAQARKRGLVRLLVRGLEKVVLPDFQWVIYSIRMDIILRGL